MATSPARRIQVLIKTIDDDRELLAAIQKYEQEVTRWEFSRSSGSWARKLYERNPDLFVPLILRHVTTWSLRDVPRLKGWTEQAEQNGHHRLFQLLYQAWLSKSVPWGEQTDRWAKDLSAAFDEADDRAARRDVLARFDIGRGLDDEHAEALYRRDPAVVKPWLEQRIERTRWWDLSYEAVADAALEFGDEEFHFFLYRRTFPTERWLQDIKGLADEVSDAEELNRELERRHLEGDESPIDPVGFIELMKRRGDDVRPYLSSYIPSVASWGAGKIWSKLAEMAADRDWWDVWRVTVQSQFRPAQFNELVQELVADTRRPEWETAALLTKIAGSAWGFAQWRRTMVFDEKTALALYRRFPELARGPFIVHYRPNMRMAYEEVAKAADAADDFGMVDMLAARMVTTGTPWGHHPVENADWYVVHYEALESEAFARRAFNVVSHVEPFPYMLRTAIRQQNTLYDVFFRSPERYRPVIGRVRALLESPAEETRHLALRMITLDGVPSSELAARNVDHLLAYLLNDVRRSTRIAAFEALARAAQTDRDKAQMICARARQALDLRQRAYPRDRLVELIGRIIHRWPQLRTEREEPVIYEQEAS